MIVVKNFSIAVGKVTVFVRIENSVKQVTFYKNKHFCGSGLVYDVHGTQACNYDYNVKSCGITGSGEFLLQD